MKRPGTFALCLFAVAAALRIAYVLLLREHPRFDAPVMDAAYHRAWALALAEGREYAEGPLFRAPLYPMMLAAVYAVFGDGTLVPRIVQALLGAASAVLTYRIGVRVAGEAAGRIAGIAVAISWVMIAFDAELLIPALLVPLLLLALDRALEWGGDDRPKTAAITGLAFGVAAIARPNVLLFMPWLFGWTLLKTKKPLPAIALTLGTLAPILPVTIHNALEGDTTLIATQGGVNFWIGNNPSSDGVTAIVPGTREGWYEGYRDAIAQAERAEGRPLKPSEVSSHYFGRAFEWMSSAPGAAMAHFAWKARLLTANVELANNQDMDFVAFWAMPPLRFTPSRWDLVFGLGVVGLALGVVARRRGAGVLAAFVAIYAVSIVLFFVNARFRVPLIPPLAIGAGFAITELVAAVRSRAWPRVATIGAPALLLVVLSNVLPSAVDTSDANGLADLGRGELARGRAAEGLAYLERAVRANPNSVQIRMALASALIAANGDAVRARRVLEEARQLPRGRDDDELLARILDVRIDGGEARAVVGEARAAIAKASSKGALRFVLGRALAASGQAGAGLSELRSLLADEPENAPAAYTIAQIVERIGSRAEARAAWQKVVDLAAHASPAMLQHARARLAKLPPN